MNIARTSSAHSPFFSCFRCFSVRNNSVASVKSLLNSNSQVSSCNVVIKGWVKTIRIQKDIAFISVNDGSCLSNLQVVISNPSKEIYLLSTGCSLEVEGTVVNSPGQKQDVEIHAIFDSVRLVGACDSSTYPLQKKYHTLEFLRELPHLRPRSNTIGAALRIRHAAQHAVQEFFHLRNYLWIPTPILTASDCEGAGETFHITGDANGERETKEPNEFFGKPVNLVVSGQLHLEAFACSLSRVYTFGPCFRAENSNTSKHLSEFWMLEAETAFSNMSDAMTLVENLIHSVVLNVRDSCSSDISFFMNRQQELDVSIGGKRIDLGGNLDMLVSKFLIVTYSEAISILQKESPINVRNIRWGDDLNSDQERWLCESYFNGVVFVTHYPASIKPFYMRLCNNDLNYPTVLGFDLLVPGIGELVGGSERETDVASLENRMRSSGVNLESHQWYTDLRRYGSVPHSGFGVGFDRLLLAMTGLKNIRDVVPVPRAPGTMLL